MKAIQSAQLGQQLNLTPQLLQSIRLLQLNAQQLQLEVTRALELNPLLELEEQVQAEAVVPAAGDVAPAEAAAVETAAFDELPESALWDAPGASWSGEGDYRMQRIAEPGSKDPFLRVLQALALELDPSELEVAAFWLEHCDDAGYLD